MLKGTWEHETLHESLAQYYLQDFILGNLKTTQGCQKKPSWGRGESTVCPKRCRSLLLISQNKIVKHAGPVGIHGTGNSD